MPRPQAEKKHTLRGHAGPVQTLVFSPDSTMLATGSEDKTVGVRAHLKAAGRPPALARVFV